jgi:voltage-gated potassium channel
VTGPPAPGRRDLTIVCGAGTAGAVAVEELTLTGRRFAIVEKDPEVCAQLRCVHPADRVVEGDATDGAVLRRAGAAEARGLVAALHEDKLNLVIAVTALQINPALRVVCHSNDDAQWPRLRRAGAVVVSSAHIGGRRLATGMIHPETTSFLTEMLAGPSTTPCRVESVVVEKGSEGDGRTLGEVDPYRRTGLQVAALVRGPGAEFLCNPPRETRLAAGDRLIVIGERESVDRLAAIVGRWE